MSGPHRVGVSLCRDFIFAGSTVVMLSIAKLYPDYWFVSCIALIPFLWHSSRIQCRETIRLGILAGICFILVTAEPVVSSDLLLKVLVYSLVFSLYGCAVSLFNRRIGYCAVYFAALWIPLEYVITYHLKWQHVLILPPESSQFSIKIGSLFGLITITFLVVLTNALLLRICKKILDTKPIPSRRPHSTRQYWIHIDTTVFVLHNIYSIPAGRAPPQCSLLSY
ncbi:MAG: hypothetical protein R3F48_02155 [Candidatus Zixiibacteriota bacterium]